MKKYNRLVPISIYSFNVRKYGSIYVHIWLLLGTDHYIGGKNILQKKNAHHPSNI